jgi:hypothetical protein
MMKFGEGHRNIFLFNRVATQNLDVMRGGGVEYIIKFEHFEIHRDKSDNSLK